MTAVQKFSRGSIYENLIKAKGTRERASDRIENLSLDMLSRPEEALQKINGKAIDRQTPDFAPDLSHHQSLENLTGFGPFDPIKAAKNPQEYAKQEKLARENKVARIRASVDQSVTIGEAAAYRTLCCYRILRELARIKGQIGAEEALSDTKIFSNPQYVNSGVSSDNNMWSEVGEEPMFKARKKSIESLINSIAEIEDDLGDPVPYEPPRNRPEMLDVFTYVVEEISDSMYILRGSSVLPDYGIYGLKGLFEPKLVPLIWPSRHEIITLESMLIEELIGTFVKKGEISARQHLIIKYGFMMHEATELMHLALRKTKDRTVADIEIARAKMILRLEHVIQEAGDAGDIRAEISGMTLLSKITGLMNETEDDSMETIASAIRELKEKREERQLANKEIAVSAVVE